MPDAVIVATARTPMGRYGGQLKDVRPDDLAAIALKAVCERAGLEPADVAGMEYPLCCQMTYVPRCNLRQAAVALPRIVAIVGNPIVSQLLLQ